MPLRMNSMSFKLFIVCFIFVLGSVVLISQLSYHYILQETRKNNDYYVDQLLSKVDQYLSVIYTSMQTISFAVSSSYTNDQDDTLRAQLDQLYEMNIDYFSNIYVIRDDLSIIGGSPLSKVWNEPLSERRMLVDQVKETASGVILTKPYYSKYSGWTITLVKEIPQSEPPVVAGLDLDLRAVNWMLKQVARENLLNIIILDEDGKLVAGELGALGKIDDENMTFQLGQLHSVDIAGSSEGTIKAKGNNGQPITLIKKPTSSFNWFLISVNNETLLERSLVHIRTYFFMLIVLAFLVSIIVAVIVTHYIRKPLGRLIGRMNKVKQGNWDTEAPMLRKDEFGLLSHTFEMMISRISELVYNLETNKELQRELEIQMLQSQINPHFLYNTLGAISNVVGLKRYEQVDPIIKALINIFEYGTADASEQVTLAEELENVKDYLYIQGIRYNRGFALTEQIDEQYLSLSVFRMMLQPIVENSLFHGYNGGRLAGGITIRVYQENGKIVIEVNDNGVGIPAEKLRQLLDPSKHGQKQNRDRQRIGLKNIDQRIRLHYGMSFGLHIESEPDQGTSVKIILPTMEGRLRSEGGKL